MLLKRSSPRSLLAPTSSSSTRFSNEFKQGEKTMEIIKEMLRSSGPDRGRADLVFVYTGENDLDQITASIRTGLKLPEQTDSDDPLHHRTRCCQDLRLCKGEQSRLPAAKRKRKIEVAKLPEVVVEEFANMTRGLVSNVALLSLAALRENTYQLLKRFHRELDPPYVTHSTLLRRRKLRIISFRS